MNTMHIADLIVRCAVEIEAISKELYYELGGNMSPVNVGGKPLCFISSLF
ncbi:hypothetical protein [Bacillus sp. SA1-12]|nr:hypothetical protein [Bacillus sp. SA1-12]